MVRGRYPHRRGKKIQKPAYLFPHPLPTKKPPLDIIADRRTILRSQAKWPSSSSILMELRLTSKETPWRSAGNWKYTLSMNHLRDKEATAAWEQMRRSLRFWRLWCKICNFLISNCVCLFRAERLPSSLHILAIAQSKRTVFWKLSRVITTPYTVRNCENCTKLSWVPEQLYLLPCQLQ